MIKDNIKNTKKYYNLSQNVESGLKYLESTDFSAVTNGTYEIKGKDVFASVQDYFTKPEEDGKFEAHRKYIDIQYIIDGEEKIGVDNINNFEKSTLYSDKNDIEFLKEKDNKSKRNFMLLKPHDFLILDPNDAHMPQISVGEKSCQVKKVVVKALV